MHGTRNTSEYDLPGHGSTIRSAEVACHAGLRRGVQRHGLEEVSTAHFQDATSATCKHLRQQSRLDGHWSRHVTDTCAARSCDGNESQVRVQVYRRQACKACSLPVATICILVPQVGSIIKTSQTDQKAAVACRTFCLLF